MLKTALVMLINLLLFALSAYLVFALVIYLFQDRYVYHPSREMVGTPEQIGLKFEGVFFEAEDHAKLHGWYLPAKSARATLLFLHGNAGNISHRLESLAIFHELGLNVFIFDYRGYGHSLGRPSELGTYLDAVAAWRYLTRKRGIPANEIIVFGRSLGGGIAAWLAARHPPRALVLESTFTSVEDMGRYMFPWLPVRLLARYRYDTLANLRYVRCPLLLVHSPDDDIVPYSQGRRLLEAASEPKYFLRLGGSHNRGFLDFKEIYVQGWRIFLNQVLKL